MQLTSDSVNNEILDHAQDLSIVRHHGFSSKLCCKSSHSNHLIFQVHPAPVSPFSLLKFHDGKVFFRYNLINIKNYGNERFEILEMAAGIVIKSGY